MTHLARPLRSNLMYRELPVLFMSIKRADRHSHTIVAMIDAYVDFLSSDGSVDSGTPIFKLNSTELTLETFKLRQEELLTGITAARLSDEYVDRLIYEPMKAAIAFAGTDLESAKTEDANLHLRLDIGSAKMWKEEAQEMVGLVQERRVLLERASADLIQRQIEIDGQRRRLAAERADLKQRIDLDNKINAIHQYVCPARGTVEFETYHGAFVKEKDHICTIRFDQPFP